ncbi:unnamed protein product [Sphagnum jensenii]|uniref:Uncharacterized protein n=1 Tax=Sphagnum jensenii TaxID=128206 RepID=A0ABP1AE08_9BRYO
MGKEQNLEVEVLDATQDRKNLSVWLKKSKWDITNNTRSCLNRLGSYNYIEFACHDDNCTALMIESLEKFGASTCASRINGGNTSLHEELEQAIANFVGKPAAMLYGMGFATNSTTIPTLVGNVGVAL